MTASNPGPSQTPFADGERLQNWSDLELLTAKWASEAGENVDAALRDLRRKGAMVRLLCRQLGIEVPRGKRGPKPKIAADLLVGAMADTIRRDYDLKGRALWTRVHHELATPDTLMGEHRNIEVASVERQYYRARKASPPARG